MFLEKVLKQILSISLTTTDPAFFILSGLVPVEAIIHLRALSLFGNIALPDDSSIEKRLAYRQLTIHGHTRSSWFSNLAIITTKYELPNPMEILMDPVSKSQWKTITIRAVYAYWGRRIKQQALTYSSLKYLSVDHYNPWKIHSFLRITETQTRSREVNRLPVKTKIVTSTYSMQSTRAAFNNLNVDPTCLLCKTSSETLEHFILHCTKLQHMRFQILHDIASACGENINFSQLCSREQLRIMLDVYSTVDVVHKRNTKYLAEIDRHTQRLCHALHCERKNYSHFYLRE
ncbi:hypothetical protein FSP39_012852 [Pinctada imbricata]|uniref:Reverse transcriptase zinc-binding domain-containing protein n=1 Tax=Pinctada imbricata TaxID=66713 RepID=A0AA89BTS7_PINIB|nr:hypothetical protein FSP39_012852 [Pinctada imbricata]